MATPISALEHIPVDFVREVSLEAINFYADGLSGIYLPDDFKQAHAEAYDVKLWKPKDRLRGKFGRFSVLLAQAEDEPVELDDVLVMGTTIGLTGVDHHGDLASLRHYELNRSVQNVLDERELSDKSNRISGVDYGATTIVLEEERAVAIKVSGSSIDFGRAPAEGRQQTCKLFQRLLGDAIQIINQEPEPRSYDRVIG